MAGKGPAVVSCRIPQAGRAVTRGGVVGHGRRWTGPGHLTPARPHHQRGLRTHLQRRATLAGTRRNTNSGLGRSAGSCPRHETQCIPPTRRPAETLSRDDRAPREAAVEVIVELARAGCRAQFLGEAALWLHLGRQDALLRSAGAHAAAVVEEPAVGHRGAGFLEEDLAAHRVGLDQYRNRPTRARCTPVPAT